MFLRCVFNENENCGNISLFCNIDNDGEMKQRRVKTGLSGFCLAPDPIL